MSLLLCPNCGIYKWPIDCRMTHSARSYLCLKCRNLLTLNFCSITGRYLGGSNVELGEEEIEEIKAEMTVYIDKVKVEHARVKAAYVG